MKSSDIIKRNNITDNLQGMSTKTFEKLDLHVTTNGGLSTEQLMKTIYFHKFTLDSLTYLLGGVLASMAILGNIEKAALIVSIPFFIEIILKLRGKLKKQSYGKIVDGRIYSLYNKIYSLPHFFTIKGRYTEKQVVFFVCFIELVFCSGLLLI